MDSEKKRPGRKERPLQTYYSTAGWDTLGLAHSITEFCQATGCDRNYVMDTAGEEQVALATEAGHGRYLERRNPRDPWETRVSRIVLARQAAAEAKGAASGQGNQPEVRIKILPGDRTRGPLREVRVDGEVRGYWRRSGSHLVLCDTTRHDCLLRVHWFARDGALHSHERNPPASVWMSGWSEAQAIRNALQAWEEGQLPPVPEQEAAARMRGAARARDERAKAMMARLLPHAEALEEFLASDRRPEAANLLAVMHGTTGDKGDDALAKERTAG